MTVGANDKANKKPALALAPPAPKKVFLAGSFMVPNVPLKVVKSKALSHFMPPTFIKSPEKNKIAMISAMYAPGPTCHCFEDCVFFSSPIRVPPVLLFVFS